MDDDTNRHDFKNQRGIALGCSEILPAETAASHELRDEGRVALLTGLHRSTR